MSRPSGVQGGHLLLTDWPDKNIHLYRAPEYNVPSLLTDRLGSCYLFYEWPEKKLLALYDDIANLLLVKFRQIPFSGFREVENVSVNLRPEQPSNRPEKSTNVLKGRSILASCFQVSSNFVERFQRRS